MPLQRAPACATTHAGTSAAAPPPRRVDPFAAAGEEQLMPARRCVLDAACEIAERWRGRGGVRVFVNTRIPLALGRSARAAACGPAPPRGPHRRALDAAAPRAGGAAAAADDEDEAACGSCSSRTTCRRTPRALEDLSASLSARRSSAAGAGRRARPRRRAARARARRGGRGGRDRARRARGARVGRRGRGAACDRATERARVAQRRALHARADRARRAAVRPHRRRLRRRLRGRSVRLAPPARARARVAAPRSDRTARRARRAERGARGRGARGGARGATCSTRASSRPSRRAAPLALAVYRRWPHDWRVYERFNGNYRYVCSSSTRPTKRLLNQIFYRELLPPDEAAGGISEE